MEKKGYFDPQSIKEHFQKRCQKVGITMQQLYQISGVHRTTIQRWWSGVYKPSWETLQKIDKALDDYETAKNAGKQAIIIECTTNGNFSRFLSLNGDEEDSDSAA